MTETTFYYGLLVGFAAVALLTFPFLFFVTAPYGRHTREGWGPKINSTLGWVIMEAPSPIVFAACYVLGERRGGAASVIFLLLWEAHYIYRAFIFPFRRRGGQKEMPLSIAASGFLFNSINGYLNGRYLFSFAPDYITSGAWMSDPRLYVGIALFVLGFSINHHADHILFNLRKPGETGYKIPKGGLYRYVSCPNYFGEIVEWSGWALLTWSPAALVFALWTMANLLPRAISHHRWYKERFPDYPRERRAVLPLVL
jgi:3-oxo-5-alpha-steroid 4-dehydrogenase 1